MEGLKLRLPEYIRSQKFGKNEILRVVEAALDVFVVDILSDYILLKDSIGRKIYIQSADKELDTMLNYVLTTEGSPDINMLLAGEQDLWWSFHRGESLSPNEIRNTCSPYAYDFLVCINSVKNPLRVESSFPFLP